MIPYIEKIELDKGKSFFVGTYSSKYFERSWHYHHEFELLLITKGYGTRVIGDNTSKFAVGDLVLIGGNIPHAWFSDPVFFEKDNNETCESVYLQFDRSIFGTRFAGLPEMKSIQTLLNAAKFGLRYAPKNESVEIMNLICDFPSYSGVDRLLNLIKILDLFEKGHWDPIVSKAYFDSIFVTKSVRIKKVHEYVMNNYMEDVSVQKAAELSEMNVSSFCRFFKKVTHKTFSQFVKETRIDFAQQLLINTSLTSNQVGFECGFSSVAYFNQCFKAISGVSPLEYRANYKKV
ncbi:AraC family transcriptional regulator [Saccharicrinis fermentans]|uniref:Melibiose operon regulatory protein n=1 Tax=Saccharicrinis fermentans DSM 9555 = JCM 21142 TaxID=869213 RepID=W7Y3T9_9BACT|nr:AraC family transcriptional regulator [Saccharicrinis fermentans]GAF02697.1 melibiose operon regulatory protein [Saccharicrinis fermentans DSM 9555 = JCM 21142]